MAKYDTTKFYWLQLKEDFFDEDAIDWLEEQPNGKEYSLFYLKLCLKSLRTNGVLIRQVGNMLVPYDHTKLGELTKTHPDTVMVAMNLLINIGLVQKLENGELYMTQVEHMIGSQSKSAFKKQQQRLTKKKETAVIEGGQMSSLCPPEKEIEKKVEREVEKEKKDIKDKIDKIDKSEYSPYDNMEYSPYEPINLTKELINANYIAHDDLNIDRYNQEFDNMIGLYSFEVVRSCLWYFVKRYKTQQTDEEGNTIQNKLAYFSVAMFNSCERIKRDNERFYGGEKPEHWLYN